jgi:hypothetical protein
VLDQLISGTLWFVTTRAVTDCRDPKELASACHQDYASIVARDEENSLDRTKTVIFLSSETLIVWLWPLRQDMMRAYGLEGIVENSRWSTRLQPSERPSL